MLSRVSLAIAVLLVVGFLYVESRPGAYRIQRSLSIAAAPEAVYATLEDLRQFSRWSPWDGRDPNLQRTFEGPERGPGTRLRWQGNAEVGAGTMTITQATPPSALRYLMLLERPWRATIENDLRIVRAPTGANVTWAVRGELGFWAKLFTLFDDPDSRVGSDLEMGLTRLKALVEKASATSARE